MRVCWIVCTVGRIDGDRNAPPLKPSHVAISNRADPQLISTYTQPHHTTLTVFYLHSLIHRNILHRVWASCFYFSICSFLLFEITCYLWFKLKADVFFSVWIKRKSLVNPNEFLKCAKRLNQPRISKDKINWSRTGAAAASRSSVNEVKSR